MLIQKGDKGKKVKDLQEKLNQRGYNVTVDGEFGNETRKAVVNFQSSNKLLVDGVVGKSTWNKLKSDRVTLDEEDYQMAADELGVEVACVKAVTEVESNGDGFMDDGRMKILFEGHWFYKLLKKKYGNINSLMNDDNKDIIYSSWKKTYYKNDQWDRMERAKVIDMDCALKSASYGMFQIMGFNHSHCGFPSAESFVSFNRQDARNQLLCFVRYCNNMGLTDALKEHRWSDFAKAYNGPRYKENKYHTKLSKAYAKYSKE